MITIDEAIKKMNDEYRPVTQEAAVKAMYWITREAFENKQGKEFKIPVDSTSQT